MNPNGKFIGKLKVHRLFWRIFFFRATCFCTVDIFCRLLPLDMYTIFLKYSSRQSLESFLQVPLM